MLFQELLLNKVHKWDLEYFQSLPSDHIATDSCPFSVCLLHPINL